VTWRTRALCTQLVQAGDAHVAWWYATGRRLRLAKTICDHCPVQQPCRDEGRRNGEAGMWGGETEEERHHGRWTAPDGPDIALDQTPPPSTCGTLAEYEYGCRCNLCVKAMQRERRYQHRVAAARRTRSKTLT